MYSNTSVPASALPDVRDPAVSPTDTCSQQPLSEAPPSLRQHLHSVNALDMISSIFGASVARVGGLVGAGAAGLATVVVRTAAAYPEALALASTCMRNVIE
jgi:hypothetical protein